MISLSKPDNLNPAPSARQTAKHVGSRTLSLLRHLSRIPWFAMFPRVAPPSLDRRCDSWMRRSPARRECPCRRKPTCLLGSDNNSNHAKQKTRKICLLVTTRGCQAARASGGTQTRKRQTRERSSAPSIAYGLHITCFACLRRDRVLNNAKDVLHTTHDCCVLYCILLGIQSYNRQYSKTDSSRCGARCACLIV